MSFEFFSRKKPTCTLLLILQQSNSILVRVADNVNKSCSNFKIYIQYVSNTDTFILLRNLSHDLCNYQFLSQEIYRYHKARNRVFSFKNKLHTSLESIFILNFKDGDPRETIYR